MRDYANAVRSFLTRGPGLRAADAPPTWVDAAGRRWRTPTIRGRLKPGQVPAHRALREFVLLLDGHACVRCGRRDRLVADHILSRRNGGAHHPLNLQALCEPCNASKVGLLDVRGPVL